MSTHFNDCRSDAVTFYQTASCPGLRSGTNTRTHIPPHPIPLSLSQVASYTFSSPSLSSTHTLSHSLSLSLSLSLGMGPCSLSHTGQYRLYDTARDVSVAFTHCDWEHSLDRGGGGGLGPRIELSKIWKVYNTPDQKMNQLKSSLSQSYPTSPPYTPKNPGKTERNTLIIIIMSDEYK